MRAIPRKRERVHGHASDQAAVTVMLSLPPSVNNLYANVPGMGRVRTKAYRAWLNEAGWELVAQRVGWIEGPYQAAITLPKMRGDADGRVKPLLDLLVAHGVTADDKHCRKLTVERDDSAELVRIEVRPA